MNPRNLDDNQGIGIKTKFANWMMSETINHSSTNGTLTYLIIGMLLNALQEYVFELTILMFNQKEVSLVLAEFASAVIWWLAVEEWSKM